MNKLKVIYDVFKTFRDKTIYSGDVNLEAKKDDVVIMNALANFEKDTNQNTCKANVDFNYNYNGKEFSLSKKIESKGNEDCCFADFAKKIHEKLHLQCCNKSGFKNKLDKIILIFGLISSIKMTENKDDSVELSLSMSDLPEEIKMSICKCLSEKQNCCVSEKCCIFDEIHQMENKEVKVSLLINKKSEIVKIDLNVNSSNSTSKININGKIDINN